MPTGYTSGLYDGEQTFEEYALGAARAFGALIIMREDPASKPIPQQFKPDTKYHEEKLAKAEAEWERVDSLTVEEIEAECQKEYDAALQHYAESRNTSDERQARYEAALELAKQYKPPTAAHCNYAKFLVDQLEDSIDHDCGHHWPREMPELQEPQRWLEKKHNSLMKDIGYHGEHIATEIARTKSRQRWVDALRESIEEVIGDAYDA